MSGKTAIEWTDATWNPVTGCTKVSQGCKHCYAERNWSRLLHLPAFEGRAFTDVRTHEDRLDQPLRWKKPRRIFVNSMSDLFHEDVPDEFIDQVFSVMALAMRHKFQILTKRPERMREYMMARSSKTIDDAAHALGYTIKFDGLYYIAWPLPNVWPGVSVEDQATADQRIPILLDTPAAVRWISAEPLLGPIDLGRFAPSNRYYMTRCEHCGWVGSSHLCGGTCEDDVFCPACCYSMIGNDAAGIDWVVVGGESGPSARPMHPDWARRLRDQCAAAGVPLLFKQWGEWAPRSACYHTLTSGQAAADIDPSATKWPCIRLTARGRDGHNIANSGDGDDCYMQKVGKKLAGRLLDGELHDGYPGEKK